MEELVMEERAAEDFAARYHDVRHSRPRPGQVMAKYGAVADLVDGEDCLKRDLIDLLMRAESGTAAALKLLQRLAGCRYPDAIRLLREMGADLEELTVEEVLAKPYRFVCEFFFYCKREDVPDSPHWEAIPVIDPSRWTNFEEAMAGVQARDEGGSPAEEMGAPPI